MVKDVISRTQFKYHETTASWNFFILRMAIVPPELRIGLQLRATYSAHIGNGGGASLASSFSAGKRAKVMTAPSESNMINISNPFILSLRIKYAITTVTIGPRLLMIAITVSGRYFVNE